jgi:hypothetical protein
MINLEFGQAVGYYITFFIILFVGGGICCLYKKKKADYTREFKLWQCSVCTFVYSYFFDQDMTICPRCGSYNKREVE